MNYTTKVGNPTAHITKNKSRLKIYNGHIIFLENGDNFEFEFHNPTTKPVLARIKINGDYISESGLVINPGQRVFLERFLDTNKKFEFSTYEVEDNDENRSAINFNGDIRIEFYNEQPISTYSNVSGVLNSWTGVNTTGSPYYGNMTFTTSNTGVSTFTTTSNVSYLSNQIETGRIEKGGTSNQSLSNSYSNFSHLVTKYYDFKILPIGNKNKTSEEIRRYCTECGTKVKKNFKFCPSCGNKI
jgi:hypothetical protein